MVVTTKSLDKTAFYQLFGGKIIDITDVYPDNTFTIQIPRLLYLYERHIGWCSYKPFCQERWKIKKVCKKLTRYPQNIRHPKFLFKDIAVINR